MNTFAERNSTMRIMRISVTYVAGLLLLATSARAALYPWSGSQVIENGNPVGTSFNFDISDPNTSITDVTVTLNLSGGYNGDLYGYLFAWQQVIVLLDRVGKGTGSDPFGYGEPGFDVALSDAAPTGFRTIRSIRRATMGMDN